MEQEVEMKVEREREGAYLLADAGKTTGLAALVYGRGDPVDLGVTADLIQVTTP